MSRWPPTRVIVPYHNMTVHSRLVVEVMSAGLRARKSARSIPGIGGKLQPDFVTAQEPGRERRVIARVDRLA